ncbi:MAG TPA: phosphoribosylaminoimidazolesuccinocarboxamide synthase [Candidatus Saccharimonadales bacterium]|nr:phosphoribosylaminoimidazolesuccinocarboxamide synthase [Candidatus Saccharimonadales bacterium]
MVEADIILKNLPDALESVDIPHLAPKQQGKVRDFYSYKGQRVTVTTDRQSAFDVVLGLIPFKGSVLNQLAAWWFEQTQHIVANHLVSLPDPNVLISRDCEAVPVEMVVRGYLTGVTNTSIWPSYERGERTIYGLKFPDGLTKNQPLPQPIITPTTHGGGASGHDDRLTRQQIIDQQIVPAALYAQMEEASLALLAFGQQRAEKQGLILVDTKYEFGLYNGKLMLIDEIHTPDSSRFWRRDSYEQRLADGQEPENFDKEFLRLWYAERGYKGDGTPPKMSDQLVVDLAQRYIGVYEMLTGNRFSAYDYPIAERITQAVTKELGL